MRIIICLRTGNSNTPIGMQHLGAGLSRSALLARAVELFQPFNDSLKPGLERDIIQLLAQQQ